MAKKKVVENELKMFITTTGKLFSEEDLLKYEVPMSKQIDEVVKWGGDIITPPYDLSRLMLWLENDVTHNSCVRQKRNDAVGIGWHLEDVAEVASSKEHFKTLAEFFNKVNEKEDMISIMKKAFLDYEGCGNGYIEIVRGTEPVSGVDKSIKALYHVVAPTVRWCSTKDKYIQQVGGLKVYFKVCGDDRVLDKDTGKFGAVTKPESVANELLQIKQYSPRSVWYGVPEWLPAIFSMYGTMKEKEFNLDFFTNFGIPSYAVIIKGITVKPETEEGIKKYFETEVKNNPHKTMVFGMPQGGEVTFEKLSVETKEASFRIYRRDNRDDILTAHHVPPYRVGIVAQGQLGGSIAADVDRMYLDSVINPRQRDWEWMINQIIVKEGFGIEGWSFRFNDIDIEDRAAQADIDTKYFMLGAMTPNEIRKKMGKPTYPGGDVFYVPGGLLPVGGEGGVVAEEAVIEEEEMKYLKDYIEDIDKVYDKEGIVIGDYVKFLSELIEKGEYHRARIIPPSRFQEDTLRTIWISEDMGIRAVTGRLKGESKTSIQAYLFDKMKWTGERARGWLDKHDEHVVLFEEA